MLYPTSIKIEKNIKSKKEKLENIAEEIVNKTKYLIFDRTNLSQKILMKLHI